MSERQQPATPPEPEPKRDVVHPVLPARQPIRWQRVRQQVNTLLRCPTGDVTEQNIWYLQRMLLWSGVMSAVASFNGNFAVRLGASNRLIGLLSSMPALLVVLLMMPAARLIETRRKRLPWILGSLLAYRAGFFLIALMPFVVRQCRAEVFAALILIMQVLLSPFNAGWDSVLADTVPERRRAKVFAQRNIILSAVVIVAVPVVGRLLDSVIFPYGYQIAYGAGFLLSLGTIYDISKLQLPDAPIPTARKRGRLSVALVRQLLAENDNYVRMVVNTLLLDLGAWLVSPLYIIYYLRHLGATDSWVGTLTAIANLSAMGGYYIWQKLIARWGENRVLKWTSPACGFFPAWVAAWGALPPILFAAVINNLIMPGVSLSHYNILLKVCPTDRRPSYISLYSVVMNAGAFVAPMVGVALADRFGVVPILFLGGAMRFWGALFFTLRPVRVPDSVSAAA